jgi:TonB family protein
MLRIGFISEEDYPVSALREEAQGDTTIRYVIGVGGRVESCELVQSSGHEDLDWTSCAIVTQRFVFMPALDEKGHPVPESRQQRIRWVLPDTQPVCKAEEVNCVPVPPRFVGPPAPPPPPAPFGPLVPLIAPPAPMRAAPPFSPPPWRSAPEVAPPAPPKAAQKPRPPR